jgi:hypothetical protein
MYQKEITFKDMSVAIKSAYREVAFSWVAKYLDTKTMNVKITPVSALEGTEDIYVNFTEYKTIRGENGG